MGDVVETYRTEFTSNMRLALQQGSQPKLAMLGMSEMGSGEMKKLENIPQPRKMNNRSVRHAPTYVNPGKYESTWVAQPDEKDDAELHDILDKVASAIEPKSAFVMSSKMAINRKRDDIWIGGHDGTGGFFGNRMAGKTGSTLVPFPSGNIVGVNVGGATSGLNIPKIVEAQEILLQNYAETGEEWYIACTAKQMTDLFLQYQVASEDFKKTYNVRVAPDGKSIAGVMSFSLVHIEFADPLLDNRALTLDGSGYRKVPFFTKSAMCRVPWYDVQSTIDMRPDLSNVWQTRNAFSETQTRTDEGRVGYIACNEA
jgi:hypothetical protein